jgi:anti-sigma factor RsiW
LNPFHRFTTRGSRTLAAYRDGALGEASRARTERRLDSDPDARRELGELDALGTAVRSAWTEGPPAPRTDHLIAALRPELARIDRERAAEREGSGLRRVFAAVRQLGRPIPIGALSAAAALTLAISAGVIPLSGSPGPGSQGTEVAGAMSIESPSAIYDLRGDQPLMIFEEGEATVIWMLPDDENVSRAPTAGGLA